MTRFKGNALMRLRVMKVWLKMLCTKGAQYIFMKGMNKRYMYFWLYRSEKG